MRKGERGRGKDVEKMRRREKRGKVISGKIGLEGEGGVKEEGKGKKEEKGEGRSDHCAVAVVMESRTLWSVCQFVFFSFIFMYSHVAPLLG